MDSISFQKTSSELLFRYFVIRVFLSILILLNEFLHC